jgi:hypothetical protein
MERKFFTITFFPSKDSPTLTSHNLWAENMLEALKKHYKLYPGIEPYYIHYKPEIKE